MPLSSILSFCPFSSSSATLFSSRAQLSFSHILHPAFSPKTKVSFNQAHQHHLSPKTKISFCRLLPPSSSSNEGFKYEVDDKKVSTHHIFTGFYDLKSVETLLDGIYNDLNTQYKLGTTYVGNAELNKKTYGLAETMVVMWLLSFQGVKHEMVTLPADINVDWIIRMRLESEKGFIAVSVNVDLTMEEINKQFEKLSNLGIRDFVWVIILKFQDEGRHVVSKSSKDYSDFARAIFKVGNGFHVVIYPEIRLLQNYAV